MSNLTVFDHPLIQHKISILRNVETSSNQFRALVEEITMLMCYESMRDLPLEEVEITTPIAKTRTNMLAGIKLAVVPILRAGLGMVNGVLNLVPSARVGHIGKMCIRDRRSPSTQSAMEKLCGEILCFSASPSFCSARAISFSEGCSGSGYSGSSVTFQLPKRRIRLRYSCSASFQ